MALALLANTAPRIIAILNANPGTFSATVSGNVGAFPTDAEILAATLEADEWVATQCYFQSVNESLTAAFDIVSGQLGNGDQIPFHHGRYSKVEVSPDEVAWSIGVRAQSRDDVIQSREIESYIGVGSADFLYWTERGHIFLGMGAVARVTYPEYTRTALLQCNKNEESLIVFRAVATLAKNASPALFEYYSGKADAGQQQIISEGTYSPREDDQP